ncbi:MAG: hypothetical protein ACOC80_12850 [Petrotogales bacterium]
MKEPYIHQIDKKTWNKWSFYINIVVFIIIAISVYLLIIDSYNAGKLASQLYGGDQISQAWLFIARDVAFLAITLTYIFFQLFKYQRIIIRRSW